MPAGSRPTDRQPSTICPDDNGCFEFSLPGRADGDQWLMLGHPLNSDTDTRDLRVTAEYGPCALAPGCILEEAASQANLMNQNLWWFDGTRYSSTLESLSPWQGYWALALSNAADANAKLLISR